MTNAPQYLFEPHEKPSLPLFEVPVVKATDSSVQGYGHLVDDPDHCEIEIVRWPSPGWRPVDEDSGDEGGTVEGIFHCSWSGDVLMAKNDAVNGEYVLGWSRDPQNASSSEQSGDRNQVLLWHSELPPGRRPDVFPARKKAICRARWPCPAMT